MKLGSAAWASALGAVLAPSMLRAQEAPDCQVRLDRSQLVSQVVVAGQARQYVSQGVWSCLGRPGTGNAGTAVWNARSDSVVRYVARGRIEFIENVEFSDSTARLTADRATYFELRDSLEARGHVRLVNLITGTVLTGPQLTYLRQVEAIRDTAELRASLRPTVEYRAEGDTAEPYVIMADKVRLRGNATWASGNVTIDRSDFASQGDSAWLDRDAGRGLIVGNAQARGQDSLAYVLEGQQIAFGLVDDRLNWVQAQSEARATSADWEIVGDTIEFSVQDDMIRRGAAWGKSRRPEARSETYALTADSLVVDTPGQQLSEVRGFGSGLATSLADTMGSENDWMAGDTVTARFDSTETGGRALTQLIALGNARALYKIFDEADSLATPAINYSRGLKIIALFKEETVERVDVIGQADGVYLEPQRIPPR